MESYFSYISDDIFGIILLYLSPEVGIPEVISENLTKEFPWNVLILKRYPYYINTIKKSSKSMDILGVNIDKYDTELNEDTYKTLLYIESISEDLANVIKYGTQTLSGLNISSILNSIHINEDIIHLNIDKLKGIIVDIYTYALSLQGLKKFFKEIDYKKLYESSRITKFIK
jgi:hypothetical protein